MNYPVIQKVVDELKKDSPSIPYVLGMLETLLSLQPTQPQVNWTKPAMDVPPVPTSFPVSVPKPIGNGTVTFNKKE